MAITIISDAQALDLGFSKSSAFIGDAAEEVGPAGTGGTTGFVLSGDDVQLDANSADEVWTFSVSGAASSGSLGSFGLVENFRGLAFGIGISGDVSYNNLTTVTEAFVRDSSMVFAPDDIRLEATDTPLTIAAAGTVVFGNHFGIGGSLAFNQQNALTRAFTQDTLLVMTDLFILGTSVDSVLAFSSGGSGAKASLSVAGSVNLSQVQNLAVAALGARTTARPQTIQIEADATLLSISSAGASSAISNGFLSVGLALDLGSLGNGADAYIGSEATLDTPDDVVVHAETQEIILSVTASMASAGSGPENRLYINNGTTNPFNGVTGNNIGGEDTLTSSVALGDIDGDGDLDLITGSFGQYNRRYLNDGTGQFAEGRDIGGLFDALGSFINAEKFPKEALIPDLTLALALGDVDGDGDLDVISGNFSQPNCVYFNRGNGTFLPGVDIGALEIVINILPSEATANMTVDDLLAMIQAKLNVALVAAASQPNEIRPVLDSNGKIIFVADRLVLSAKEAEANLAEARRDGVLQTDSTGTPLTFTLTYDGVDFTVSINPNETTNNPGVDDLVADLQAAVDAGITPGGAGRAGDVRVTVDAAGIIIFVLADHSLGRADQVAEAVESSRDVGVLTANVPFTLTYDGANFSGTFTVASTAGNTTIEELAADLQVTIDAALTASGAGLAGDVLVVVANGEIAFQVASHTLGDTTGVESQIAAARRSGRIETRPPSDFEILLGFTEIPLFLSFVVSADSNPTTSVALGDIDNDGDLDLVAGNMSKPSRFYLNDGTGVFGAGHDVSSDVGFTTSIALADLNADGFRDVVIGNLGFDLTRMIEQGLISLTDFLADTAVNIVELISSGLVSLLDLLEAELITRFGFDPLAPVTIADLISTGITTLADLVREGLLDIGDFDDIDIPAALLTASGLVTQAELLAQGVIDAADNVSLQDLVDSGIVFLEELIGDNLVDIGDLNVPDVNLGDLLSTPLADIFDLVREGIADVTDLVVTELDLRSFIQSGIVSLTELAQEELLEFLDLDQRRLDLQNLTDQLAFGAPIRVYFNDNTGNFLPGVDVSADRFITKSVAVADVDGDGDRDIVAGNSGTGSRLYRNDGTGNFATGVTISDVGPLTVAILLEDMDGDGDRDLVTANFGSTNRIYENNGDGTFAAGTNISLDANTTSSIAAADLNGDGRRDLVAGDSKPAIAAAGSAAYFDVAIDGKAHIDERAVVLSDGSVFVTADDTALTVVDVGADVSGTFLSVGASAASPNISRDLSAYVLGIVTPVRGSGFTSQQGLFVTANAYENMLGYASGRATSDQIAILASGVVPRMDSLTQAYIGSGAVVDVRNAAETSELSVIVRADHQTDTLSAAGGYAGATLFGFGAAIDAQLLTKRVKAFTNGATITTQDHLLVEAISHDDPDAFVLGAGTSLGLSVAGSVSFVKLDKETYSYIEGGVIRADGNVIVWAESNSEFRPIAGAGALGLGIGVGVSAAVFMKADDTQAWISASAQVDARALRQAATVFTGEKAGNVPNTMSMRGVAVSAVNLDFLDPLAVAGALAGVVGAAGSVTGTILDNHVAAFIGQGAVVNRNDAGAAATQLVHILAWDDTVIAGLEDSISAAFLVAASGTFTFSELGKNTEAYIDSGADVDSRTNVEVRAKSTEDLRSIGGTVSASFLVAGTFVGGIHKTNVQTRAYTNKNSRINATNNVLVLADNDADMDVIAFAGANAPISGNFFYSDAELTGATEASVDSIVTATTLQVSATSRNNPAAYSLLTARGSITGNGVIPKAKTDVLVAAFLGSDADIVIPGALTLTATSTNTPHAFVIGVELSAISISFIQPTMHAGGATRAFVAEGATVTASSLNPTAHADNTANSVTPNLSTAGINVDVFFPTMTTTHVVEAYIGQPGNVAFDAKAGVDNDRNTINIGAASRMQTGQLVRYSNGNHSSIAGLTHGQAYFAHRPTPTSSTVTLHSSMDDALTGENPIDISPLGDDNRTQFLIPATDTTLTGEITITGGGAMTISATSVNTATASEIALNNAGIQVSVVRAEMTVGGVTRAHAGGRFTINANGLNLLAEATNEANARAFNLAITGVLVTIPARTAKTTHEVESYVALALG